ncbi:restriction endonuclease subunit S [Ideonella sp. TBM-1]|uniref:Restriction endonuclease subunit S n=2 Tax=Ideonella livida TaxID=2707176 RepID=A0A7C9TIH2_9BURK|nr:restriction endonuclease subunit S [Ideonella livida]
MLSIRELSVGVFDGPHATPELHEEGAAVFLGIPNIRPDGSLDLAAARWVAEKDLAKWNRRVTPQPRDIVFTYEATLNRYALIPDGLSCTLGRRTALIRPNPEVVDHRYLFYYFYSAPWRAQIEANTLTGATVDRIPLTTFPDFRVFVPDLMSQGVIAEVLATYDNLIAINQRRITLLERAARLLYREWFVNLRFPGGNAARIEDGLPVGWVKGTTHDFVAVLSGGTPKTGMPHYWGGEIPFFTPKDCPSNFYVVDTEKRLTESGLGSCNSRLYPRNTTFITARGTVGKIALAQRSMAMNQSCYALAPKQAFDELFLFLAISDAVEHFKQVAVGGVFDAIVVDTFKVIPFVLPPLELVAKFGDLVRPKFEQIANLLLQNQQLSRARDLLLPKLMSGQLDVSRLPMPEAAPPAA